MGTILEKTGVQPLHGDALYAATLAADILSNALYYSLIGIGRKKHIVSRGVVYGVAAGIGALALTKPLGLSDAPVTRTSKIKVLTVGYYLMGGLVAACILKVIKDDNSLH